MHKPCTAGRPRGLAGPSILTSLSALSACTDTGLGGPGAVLLALALALCAGLAYALGSLRSRHLAASELRQARTALRRAEQLHAGWSWRTDGMHRLVAWHAPGLPVATTCALFDPDLADAALQARLLTGQSFAGLRLLIPQALEGSHGWELRGVPRLDDSGAFAGFEGSARPTDDDDALRLAACAVSALLAANPMPALLARQLPAGWQVEQMNPAAQLLWPTLAGGSDLSEALTQLPAALAAAVAGSPRSGGCLVQGWSLAPVGPLPGGACALVLAQVAQEALGAHNHAQESDAFSFTLSHDLRAPIRVVDGFTRIVKEDYGHQLDRVGNDHLDRVLGAAARMNLMIDALLTLARLSQQPLARQRVNLSQLAGFVIDDLRRTTPERPVDTEVEAGLSAWGDPTLLRLVLENLLGNAWKYTARTSQPRISLRALTQGEKTTFEVRDNGAGFDMRSAERLFGLFQRLHSASDFPGHGMGLASVRRIVQRHGGEIWAEAEPGRGAVFHFTLPA